MLIMIPTIMFCVAYSDLRDRRVVSVPEPAINGKANGTIEALSAASSRNKLIPKIISIAIMNITIEPAMAKDEISRPMILSISSPINRKRIINKRATKEAFSDCI